MGDYTDGWKTGKVIAFYQSRQQWLGKVSSDFLQSEHQQPAGQSKGTSKTIC